MNIQTEPKMNYPRIVFNPNQFFELILQPVISDVVGASADAKDMGGYAAALKDFRIVDNVSLARGKAIGDLFMSSSPLQRKDRSCNTNWTNLGTTDTRRLTIAELYAATMICGESFFDGDFRDYRNDLPMFLDIVSTYIRKNAFKDVFVNTWFGDTTRLDDYVSDGIIQPLKWNSFDGVIKKIAYYASSACNGQLYQIPSGQLNPGGYIPSTSTGILSGSQAWTVLNNMYYAQNALMKGVDDTQKRFYVNKDLAAAYADYLTGSGTSTVDTIRYIQGGVPVYSFKGIDLVINPFFDAVLYKLNKVSSTCTPANLAILTLQDNFIFGFDKTYGGGPLNDMTFEFYWDYHDRKWKYRMDLTAGVEITAPQHVVYASTQISTYA
jgi:hypothetical protein